LYKQSQFERERPAQRVVAWAHCAKQSQLGPETGPDERRQSEGPGSRREESCDIASMPRFGKQSQFDPSVRQGKSCWEKELW
jgi:hypothetical protein